MKKAILILAIALLAISCSNNNSKKEREALQFLYSSMQLCDRVDYSEDYFVQNIPQSFEGWCLLPKRKQLTSS